MNQYFEQQTNAIPDDVSDAMIDTFRGMLPDAFRKNNADPNLADRVPDATIRNAIRQNISPFDVAWAWLQ